MATEREPFARSSRFWRRLGHAAGLGLTLGVVALLFLVAIAKIVDLIWPEDIDTGFLGGDWWWVALMGAVGLIVGILRTVLDVKEDSKGVFELAMEKWIDTRYVIRDVIVSFVTLIGGMSLGPEAPLGTMGAAFGTWISDKRGLDEEDRATNTVSGMSGAFGGLFTAPFLSTMLISEAGAIGVSGFSSMLIPSLLASTLGFAVVFFVSGQVFLDLYQVEPFEPEVWNYAAAVVLGIVGATLAACVGVSVKLAHRAAAPLAAHPIIRATIGGLVLGVIAVAFPLTLFSGSEQLAGSLDDAAVLGGGLLLAIVAAKIVAVAISVSTGFIGGVIFPMIFIGGTAGAAVHQFFPDVPEALAVSCLFVAVPAATARLPFSLLVIAAISLTLGSPAAAAPAGLAGITSYVLVSGLAHISPEGQRDPNSDDAAVAEPGTADP